MIGLSIIAIFIVLIWATVYTASFGIWTLKDKNKIGAIALFILALTVLALPIYAMYFRE